MPTKRALKKQLKNSKAKTKLWRKNAVRALAMVDDSTDEIVDRNNTIVYQERALLEAQSARSQELIDAHAAVANHQAHIESLHTELAGVREELADCKGEQLDEERVGGIIPDHWKSAALTPRIEPEDADALELKDELLEVEPEPVVPAEVIPLDLRAHDFRLNG